MTDFIIELYLSFTNFFDTSVFAESAGLFNPLAESGSNTLLGFAKKILSGLQPIFLIAITVVFAIYGVQTYICKAKRKSRSYINSKNIYAFCINRSFYHLICTIYNRFYRRYFAVYWYCNPY